MTNPPDFDALQVPPAPADVIEPESDHHRIEVLSVDGKTINLSLVVLAPGGVLPKTTHQLGQALVSDTATGDARASIAFITRLATRNWVQSSPTDVLDSQHLPSAAYRIVVADSKLIENLQTGMRWETSLDAHVEMDDAKPAPLVARALPADTERKVPWLMIGGIGLGVVLLMVGIGVIRNMIFDRKVKRLFAEQAALYDRDAQPAKRPAPISPAVVSPSSPTPIPSSNPALHTRAEKLMAKIRARTGAAPVAVAEAPIEVAAPAAAVAPVRAASARTVAPSHGTISTPVMFELRTVDFGQRPTDLPPFHARGGAWTFADAHSSTGCSFTVGVQLDPRGGAGSATLGFANLKSANCLLKTLGSHDPLPDTMDSDPVVMTFPLTVVGARQARTRDGHFFASPTGGWLTTSIDVNGSELPLNVNLQKNKGSFFSRDLSTSDGIADELGTALLQ